MEKEQSLQEMVLGQPHTKEQSWTPPYLTLYVKISSRGFPGGLSSSSNAGDGGSIPGQGTKSTKPATSQHAATKIACRNRDLIQPNNFKKQVLNIKLSNY